LFKRKDTLGMHRAFNDWTKRWNINKINISTHSTQIKQNHVNGKTFVDAFPWNSLKFHGFTTYDTRMKILSKFRPQLNFVVWSQLNKPGMSEWANLGVNIKGGSMTSFLWSRLDHPKWRLSSAYLIQFC